MKPTQLFGRAEGSTGPTPRGAVFVGESRVLRVLVLAFGLLVLFVLALGRFEVNRMACLVALGVAIASTWRLAVELPRREAAERGLREANAILEARTRAVEATLVEARSATEAKSQFLACMSHEIRTPLNAVLGMAELLTGGALDPEQRGYADDLRVGGEMLQRVVGDILDYSQLEAGKQQLELVDFALDLLLEDCAKSLAPGAREKGLALVTSVESGTPTALKGDVNRLRRLITNFLDNAVKFTSRGRIVLRARQVARTPTEATVRIEVQDTGIGIPSEVRSRLFQAFSQADSSTTRTFGGTGLGLAICRKIAELMRGTVGVDSAAGQGATFWAIVPLELQLLPKREPGGEAWGKPRAVKVDLAGTRTEGRLRAAVPWAFVRARR